MGWDPPSVDGRVRGRVRQTLPPPPQTGRVDRAAIPPGNQQGCLRRRDLHTYAIFRTTRSFEERQESDREYTIFPDSEAAISRMATDRTGPGQSFAHAAHETCRQLQSRGNCLTSRRTPTHEGIEGSEVADVWAKAAAENDSNAVDRAYLRQASLSHLSRKQPRQEPQRPRDGSAAMSAVAEVIGPPEDEGSEPTSGGSARPWPVGTTSCPRAAPPRAPSCANAFRIRRDPYNRVLAVQQRCSTPGPCL